MRPIFIVGCGHSGTTLLAAMLDSHPSIAAFPGESNAFLSGSWRARAPAILADFARQAACSGRSRIAEKTPRHIHHLDRIHAILPDARIVYMVRDGRDVAWSIAKRTASIDLGVERWIADNEAGLRFLAARNNMLMLRYEDLIAAPETQLRRLCAFIDEPFDASMLRFSSVQRHWFGVKEVSDPGVVYAANKSERNKRHVLKRNWQINQPLFDGRAQWRSAPAAQMAAVLPKLHPLLNRLGYAC